MKIRKQLLNKVSNLVILFATSTYACNLVFHEVKIPESLKK
ncbi:Cyclic lactone autoinducer peptide OS=Lysinibacillus sphaericus OX=1421 GN=LS41612_16600 PE=4 SV=1 [Lysinibacillus sphaericus]